jgi:hypothetical protein
MTALAVRARALVSARVFLSRHRLKVRRVHAFPVAADVIELEAGWDWPDEPLIGRAMRRTTLEHPVVAARTRRQPSPTAGLGDRVELGEKQKQVVAVH